MNELFHLRQRRQGGTVTTAVVVTVVVKMNHDDEPIKSYNSISNSNSNTTTTNIRSDLSSEDVVVRQRRRCSNRYYYYYYYDRCCWSDRIVFVMMVLFIILQSTFCWYDNNNNNNKNNNNIMMITTTNGFVMVPTCHNHNNNHQRQRQRQQQLQLIHSRPTMTLLDGQRMKSQYTTTTTSNLYSSSSLVLLSSSSSSSFDDSSSLPEPDSSLSLQQQQEETVVSTKQQSLTEQQQVVVVVPPRRNPVNQPPMNNRNNNNNNRNNNNNNNNNPNANDRNRNNYNNYNNRRGIHNNKNQKVHGTTTTTTTRTSSSNSNSKQLNQQLVQATSAQEVLLLLQQHAKLQLYQAGHTLNNVNHSTSLHRIAKHAVQQQQQQQQPTGTSSGGGGGGGGGITTNNNFKQNRAQILYDPRFALLLTSIAEHISSTTSVRHMMDQTSFFQTRELSNIGWALAKLKLPPPTSIIPAIQPEEEEEEEEQQQQQQQYDNNNNMDEYLELLLQATSEQLVITATAIREAVLHVATERTKERSSGDDVLTTGVGPESWIPQLSQLAGQILDAIGVMAMVLDHIVTSQQQHHDTSKPTTMSTMTTTTTKTTNRPKTFQMQEWSNLLWAWATAGRADPIVFGLVVRNMIDQQKSLMECDTNDTTGSSSSVVVHPQEWSNSIWAFATAQCYDSHVELLEYVAELLSDAHLGPGFINDFKSQELSNTIWGVATLLSNKKLIQQHSTTESSSSSIVSAREQRAALTILRHVIQSVIRRKAEGFRTQELSNTAWATATLGFGINQGQETSVLNNYLVLQTDAPEADTKLMVEMIYSIADSAMKQLPRFWSQELNNLAWALARLLSDNNNLPSVSTTEFQTRVKALLRGIASQLADPRRSVNSQDIGTTLWSLATLEFCDKELYRNIAVRLTPEQAHRSKPQELSNTIWAFATTEMEIDDIDIFDTSLVPTSKRQNPPTDPITVCFGVAAYELMRRPNSFKPQEIKDVLWSFSKVGLRHPELFKFVAEHLVGSENKNTDARGLDDFSTQGMGNMAWAYARQAQLSEMVSERLNLNSGNGKMTTYKTIYFDVGEYLLLKLFSSIAETSIRVYDKLEKGKPQDISNTAWAFASLGLKDERYMDAAKDALVNKLTRYARGERNVVTTFKGQELANLLWAMATLNVSAGNVWSAVMLFLQSACANSTGSFTATSISRYFKRKELASMAWACSVFGNYPEELMQFLYIGLFGLKGKEQDPKHMEIICNDSGLQMQAIMTLIYVQTEIDKRGCCQDLSLPDNFPDGWKETAIITGTREDHITELSLELNLSTSKIQRAVSAAFSRIGFDHVEEHTITMKEMAESHGVRIPAKNIEVLSIDIANVQQKVAIEVDGPSHFVSRTDDSLESTVLSSGFSKVVKGKLEYQFGWTGERQEMNGPTVLKDRLLNSFGWKVLHLPFWEWYALGGDAAAEEKYCQLLLDKDL